MYEFGSNIQGILHYHEFRLYNLLLLDLKKQNTKDSQIFFLATLFTLIIPIIFLRKEGDDNGRIASEYRYALLLDTFISSIVPPRLRCVRIPRQGMTV